MKQSSEMWQQLKLLFSPEMKNVLEQQHLTVQFIGLAGRHLFPEEKDKSNINLNFFTLGKNIHRESTSARIEDCFSSGIAHFANQGKRI